MKSTTRCAAEVPTHVPAHLVHDFDIYNPSQGSGDHFGALRHLNSSGTAIRTVVLDSGQSEPTQVGAFVGWLKTVRVS